MYQRLLLAAGTVLIIWASGKPLRDPRCHGFYRCFAWELILLQVVVNLPCWFDDPFPLHQIVSWLLLCASLYPAVAAWSLFRRLGGPARRAIHPTNYAFENTSRLIMIGIFRYIRHPMYCSLLLLLWGAFFKSPSWIGAGISLLGTTFLTVTAKVEERENVQTFGDDYRAYMGKSKMFVPFVL